MVATVQVVSATEVIVKNNGTITPADGHVFYAYPDSLPFVQASPTDKPGEVTVPISKVRGTRFRNPRHYRELDVFGLVTAPPGLPDTANFDDIFLETNQYALTLWDLAYPSGNGPNRQKFIGRVNRTSSSAERGWGGFNDISAEDQSQIIGGLLGPSNVHNTLRHMLFLSAGIISMDLDYDLSAAFEANGAIDIVTGGKTYSFDIGLDKAEPYVWTPSNSADLTAVFAALESTSAEAELWIRDGPLASVRRGAHKGSKPLTGIYVGGKPANVYRGDKQIWARP